MKTTLKKLDPTAKAYNTFKIKVSGSLMGFRSYIVLCRFAFIINPL
jgi:hypothetical protein